MPYMNCGFCRNAGKEWTNHCLMDKKGNVTCMFLKQHSCPYCNIKGHSKTFCPEIKAKEQRKANKFNTEFPLLPSTKLATDKLVTDKLATAKSVTAKLATAKRNARKRRNILKAKGKQEDLEDWDLYEKEISNCLAIQRQEIEDLEDWISYEIEIDNCISLQRQEIQYTQNIVNVYLCKSILPYYI